MKKTISLYSIREIILCCKSVGRSINPTSFMTYQKCYFRDSVKCFNWETRNGTAFSAVMPGPCPRAQRAQSDLLLPGGCFRPDALRGPGRNQQESDQQELLGFPMGPELRPSFGGTLL